MLCCALIELRGSVFTYIVGGQQDWPGRCIRLISEQVNLLKMRVALEKENNTPSAHCAFP